MLYYNALCYYVLIIPKLSQVYSINTDRFYITNLKRTIRKKSDVKFEVNMLADHLLQIGNQLILKNIIVRI